MAGVVDVLPNQTLFCYNLETKVSLAELKSLLFELFVSFGKVLEVVASKADPKKRGTAFIVFVDIGAATAAIHHLQGWELLGRRLGINYARTKSNAVAMIDGTFKIRRKKHEQPPPPRLEPPPLPTVKAETCATLFVENLPIIMNQEALAVLFKQYPGFQEARVVSGRGIGFVDFNNDLQAELATQGLNGFLVTPEHALKVSLAKKNQAP